ncbi:MAG: SurA N-terminal domain-containing protein [Candidatus Levybacteria bacterium]|nr:SurA N-terminal domain-containing protein [Candidatus Levybacteria bacterium]
MATKRTTKRTTSSSPAKTSVAPKRASRPSRSSSRSTTKTTVVTDKPVVKEQETKSASTSSSASTTASSKSNESPKIRKSYIALIATILLLGALLYYFRGLFVAAVVNGQPISRLEVVRQTEMQSGKQTLDTLVRNALIEQRAKEQNVTVSEQETTDEIKKLQDNLSKQGQNLEQVLTAQGMSQEDLRKLIRLDKLVAKMVGKDVKVTDAEVATYIEQNAEALPQDTNEAELKTQVTEQLKQQKTNEKVRVWLADLQKNATVNYFVQY